MASPSPSPMARPARTPTLIDAWWDDGHGGHIQPAEFLLGRGGVVLGSMYASAPVGRMVAEEAIQLITTREQAPTWAGAGRSAAGSIVREGPCNSAPMAPQLNEVEALTAPPVRFGRHWSGLRGTVQIPAYQSEGAGPTPPLVPGIKCGGRL